MDILKDVFQVIKIIFSHFVIYASVFLIASYFIELSFLLAFACLFIAYALTYLLFRKNRMINLQKASVSNIHNVEVSSPRETAQNLGGMFIIFIFAIIAAMISFGCGMSGRLTEECSIMTRLNVFSFILYLISFILLRIDISKKYLSSMHKSMIILFCLFAFLLPFVIKML
ncbi:MAG: hypothetical protein QG568_317 [Patescibacteria group bacterium]|nr:hypothetical protein [Patescibacteria group bacterium]